MRSTLHGGKYRAVKVFYLQDTMCAYFFMPSSNGCFDSY